MRQLADASPVLKPGVVADPGAPGARLQSVDLLRGVVMVVMALDHVRDFVGVAGFSPTDLSRTTPALFLTRWITHFCAPAFLLLAGCAAYLYGARGRTRGELSRFLVSRGLWLVFLELTLFRFAWSFDLSDNRTHVIWAIGWSMVALGALVWLPLWAVGMVGVVMIAAHNAFDGVHGGTLWAILHEQAPVQLLGLQLRIAYPLVPWIGVMAAGYALGPVLRWDSGRRGRLLVLLGVGMTALFFMLRAGNLYGDPVPWSRQLTALFSALSFLNVTKYPASLLFLLVTLGPSLLLLAALDRTRVGEANPLLVFGRVPFFYYLCHLLLIHLVGVATLLPQHGLAALRVSLDHHPGSGLSLGWVYLVWAAVVVVLYWPCRWYAEVKRRSRNPLLGYL